MARWDGWSDLGRRRYSREQFKIRRTLRAKLPPVLQKWLGPAPIPRSLAHLYVPTPPRCISLVSEGCHIRVFRAWALPEGIGITCMRLWIRGKSTVIWDHNIRTHSRTATFTDRRVTSCTYSGWVNRVPLMGPSIFWAHYQKSPSKISN